ncbi:MAG TPA: protein-L-isoaspartate O-methyltransferase [Gammaproteobacteria bacterium]
MNLEQARHNMIEQQIRPWEVLDQRLLDLLVRVPREDFVPPRYRKLAFADIEIPLDHGEVMMQPRLEARLLQALDIQPNDRILEIGTGSGYVTALLAHLGRHVLSIELHAELIEQARQRLARHGITNVNLVHEDAAAGWSGGGVPFDVILLTGSVPELPDAFRKLLTIGGRLVAVVGTAPIMEATLVTRLGETEWSEELLFETMTPPLHNVAVSQKFIL